MDELDGRNFIEDFGGRSLKSAMARIPPVLFTIPLSELELRATPTDVEQFIKQKFWVLALSRPIRLKSKRRVSELYTDICTYTHFWCNILQNPTKFAWILRQRHEERVLFKALSHSALSNLTEYLNNLPKDKDGNFTPASVGALIRGLELLFKYARPEAG